LPGDLPLPESTFEFALLAEDAGVPAGARLTAGEVGSGL
jgi:hypothetical protein